MSRAILLCILSGLLFPVEVHSQLPVSPAISSYSYYPPDTDKPSWQRLNLWLSSTFLYVVKEALTDRDSCLLLANHSLGMSRFPILAEGFGDEKLLAGSKWIDQGDPNTGIRILSEATGKKRLQLLLLLGSYYAFQPRAYTSFKDSVNYFLGKAITESKALKEERLSRIALCLLGKIYIQVHDPKGDSIYSSLIDQCRKAGDKVTEARAIAYRGIFMAPLQTTFQQKIADLQQASDLYQSLGDIEGQINVLTGLGYMFCAIGELQRAYDILSKAFSLEEEIQFPYTQYSTEALAMVTVFQGKFGEPFRFTRQTIKVAESTRDSIGWAYFYSRLAILYDYEGRIKESYDMALKAVGRFIIARDPGVYGILQMVAAYMYQQGRAKEALHMVQDISKKVSTSLTISDLIFYHHTLTSCYINLDMLDSAESHVWKLDSLETMAEAVRGSLRRSAVNDQFAIIFFQRGEYRKAKEQIEKHFSIPSFGHRSLMNDIVAYRLLIETDSALGNKDLVIAHYKEYTKLLDSSFKVTKLRQAEELQVIYETEDKERQIAVLNHQAKQTRLVKNLTLGGIAAAVVIAILLYRQNRLKQKSNKIISQKNGQLEDLLADKEWLLKEIHHRVKNNLQIIMSLLNSQSKYINNDAALTAINDSERRVQAISLIHQKLYQSENSSMVDMRQYIDELISYLQESFDTGSRAVIEQDIEPLKLDVAKAIPLGLIINEGVVNAMKYAFPEEQKGIIRISLKIDDRDHLLVTITDNGVGISSELHQSKKGSLGFNLMRGLAKQMDGILTIESSNGLRLSVRFNPSTNLSYEPE